MKKIISSKCLKSNHIQSYKQYTPRKFNISLTFLDISDINYKVMSFSNSINKIQHNLPIIQYGFNTNILNSLCYASSKLRNLRASVGILNSF